MEGSRVKGMRAFLPTYFGAPRTKTVDTPSYAARRTVTGKATGQERTTTVRTLPFGAPGVQGWRDRHQHSKGRTMAKGIYVSATTPGSGKSLVALGLAAFNQSAHVARIEAVGGT